MNATEFLNELKKIFGQDVKQSITGQEKVKSARVNTNEALSMTQVSDVFTLANESNLSFNVKRSGAGLKVQFN